MLENWTFQSLQLKHSSNKIINISILIYDTRMRNWITKVKASLRMKIDQRWELSISILCFGLRPIIQKIIYFDPMFWIETHLSSIIQKLIDSDENNLHLQFLFHSKLAVIWFRFEETQFRMRYMNDEIKSVTKCTYQMKLY